MMGLNGPCSVEDSLIHSCSRSGQELTIVAFSRTNYVNGTAINKYPDPGNTGQYKVRFWVTPTAVTTTDTITVKTYWD